MDNLIDFNKLNNVEIDTVYDHLVEVIRKEKEPLYLELMLAKEDIKDPEIEESFKLLFVTSNILIHKEARAFPSVVKKLLISKIEDKQVSAAEYSQMMLSIVSDITLENFPLLFELEAYLIEKLTIKSRVILLLMAIRYWFLSRGLKTNLVDNLKNDIGN